MPLKTKFPITNSSDLEVGTISIIGEKIVARRKEDSEEAYIRIDLPKKKFLLMRTEDIELFGINILKAIDSPKLKRLANQLYLKNQS